MKYLFQVLLYYGEAWNTGFTLQWKIYGTFLFLYVLITKTIHAVTSACLFFVAILN